MKKLLKKNQFVVTVLALLIAIAGYMNYADTLKDDTDKNENNDTYEEVYNDDTLLYGDEDILSLDVDFANETVLNQNETNQDEEIGEYNNSGETNTENDSEEPGMAILTSGKSMSTFTIEAKVNREQMRSKNKDTLLEIINNEQLSEEDKKVAVDAMVELTKVTELENNIETLLDAKGYEDVVVSISENQADIVINSSQVTDSDRAIIEDVITRKTDIELNSIVITPLTNE